MLQSLKLYAGYFLKTSFSTGRKFVLNDIKRFMLKKDVFRQDFTYLEDEKKEALFKAINWLMAAQKMNNDGGMGSYHLVNKWSSSYPETTGYIIPTLIRYGKEYNRQEALDSAIRAADFLFSIQKDSGGWQGGRVGENRPEIVFNTAQVIRGMIAAYHLTGGAKYLNAADKAGRWLSKIIHPEGFWQDHALMGQARVYDTFVDVPLLQLYEITGDGQFRDTAIRNLEWVIQNKIQENGWFEDCDNTVKRNDKPILHTIAYTIDGLIDSGLITKEDKYLESAAKGSVKLRDLFLSRGFLNARYDRNWTGSEYFLCTGGAQMAITWLKLYQKYGDDSYPAAASQMINLLVYIQSRSFSEKADTLGAIPGSFPIWGRYEPFAFPNWATKFFCDALMLEAEVCR
jgi:uncharacterized protein YyaL (SSP411 family)